MGNGKPLCNAHHRLLNMASAIILTRLGGFSVTPVGPWTWASALAGWMAGCAWQLQQAQVLAPHSQPELVFAQLAQPKWMGLMRERWVQLRALECHLLKTGLRFC